MISERSEQRSSVGQLMGADHAHLEQLFRAMMTCMLGADPERIRERWLELDRALEQHLCAEEELILPAFARQFPASAARLRQEHREIRAALVELGVDLDLHSLCAASAASFIEALRSHAAYEDAVVYAWAQQNLPDTDKVSLLERLRNLGQPDPQRPHLEGTP